MHLPFWEPHKHRLTLGSFDPWGLIRHSVSPLTINKTHIYCVGTSGMGKSQFLLNIMEQLAWMGAGFGLIDPHGDLLKQLLACLASPEGKSFLDDPNNRQRIVYLEAKNQTHAIPWNLLSLSETITNIAGGFVEGIRRAYWATLKDGPRFSDIAHYGTLTLIKNNLTLLEFPRLLTDPDFRLECRMRANDPDIDEFFDSFDRWGKDQPLMIESTLNKVRTFKRLPTLKYMVGANDNQLDFKDIMDEGKIFLAHLGGVDDETQNLLGSLLTSFIEIAARSREEQPEENRRHFYLIIDEFQNFVANEGSAITLAKVLSECRKYHVVLILAHQGLSQIEYARVLGALGQARIKVIFATERDTAEVISPQIFTPNLYTIKDQVKNEDIRDSRIPLYASILELRELQTQAIQRLNERQVLVSTPKKHNPIALWTLYNDSHRLISYQQLRKLREELIQQSGKPISEIAKEIEARSQLHRLPLPTRRSKRPFQPNGMATSQGQCFF